jgi:PAS domain S-box-containing protein
MEASRPNVTPLRTARRPRGTPVPSEAERLAELSSVLLASADADLRLVFLNGAWERVLGWLPEELAGSALIELVHDDERAHVAEAFAYARETGPAELDFDCRLATRDGRWRWLSWKVRFESGRWYGAGQDTTERRAQERELTAVRERLAEAQRIAGIGSFDVDLATGRVWWSDHHYAIYGLDPARFEPTMDGIMAFIHPDDREAVAHGHSQMIAGAVSEGSQELRIVRLDGEQRLLRGEARAVRDESGKVTRVVGTAQDITEHRQAERAVAAREAQLRALVEQVPAIVYTAGFGTDAEWDYVSPQIESMLGYSAEEWRASRNLWWGSIHPEDRAQVLNDEGDVAEPGGRLRSEYRLRHRDGSWLWVRDEATTIQNEHGELRFQGVLLDITERKRAEAAVRDTHAQLQAIIDASPLVIWAKDAEGRRLFANGEYDQVLARARSDDDASDRQVLTTGRAIEFEERIEVNGRERIYLVHKFPLRDDDGAVNGVCGAATDITERGQREEALRAKVEWSFRIRSAIEHDRLVLHSQPIVELATGRVVQEELLLRMRGEDGELIMPGRFLPPAERFNLAPELDRWVIGRAVRMARERRVEVNLSAQSIGDPALPDYIEAQLAAAGADPAGVVFEITETAAAQDLDQARRLAERLSELGCGFALDDFGTGYGSFTYLKHLPVSYIKIDMEFVRTLRADSPDRQVVSAIVDVARNFGIETIAEGVESREVLELLKTLGVDYAQGFLLGRPTPTQAPD